ncbi:MAG: amino acid ABC transporter substrate-binding protein, partial [Proteobacteria bacterium]|nr:amino acid ABC transporter substrate-binding protein [Pseudomonadota bacterium]
PNIKRLLGLEGDTGKSLGLAPEWSYNIIKQVGNYGEVYEANVGSNTPIGLARSGSPNQLWTKGGILYAPPVR